MWRSFGALCLLGLSCQYIYLYMFCVLIVVGQSLTATVEPFLPTPPARMTRMICQKDQPPHNKVIMDIEDHTCRSPYTYKFCVVFVVGCVCFV